MRSPLGDAASPTAPFADLVADIDRLLGVDAAARDLLAPTVVGGDAHGRLEDTGIELLTGRAFVRAFSGWLRLEAPEGRGAVRFEGGRPVDIVFVNMPPSARTAATPAVVERWFFALGSFASGSYAFESPGADSTPHRQHALRHPAVLVNEIVLRKGGSERLGRWLGSEENHFRLCQPVAMTLLDEALAPVWEPALRAALRLCDGARSFRDVARGSHLPSEQLARAAFVLFCFGALEPAGLVEAMPAAQPPASDRQLLTDGARLDALFALAERSDYFAFLGVDRGASATEIRAACARLDAEIADPSLHPDVAVASGRTRVAIAEVLAEARRILGHEELRRRYRAGLANPG